MVLLSVLKPARKRESLNYGANILPKVFVTAISIFVIITGIEGVCEEKTSRNFTAGGSQTGPIQEGNKNGAKASDSLPTFRVWSVCDKIRCLLSFVRAQQETPVMVSV